MAVGGEGVGARLGLWGGGALVAGLVLLAGWGEAFFFPGTRLRLVRLFEPKANQRTTRPTKRIEHELKFV